MFTPKSIDELHAVLRVLDDAARSIDAVIAEMVPPERPPYDDSEANWVEYAEKTHKYYGEKNGLHASLQLVERQRMLIANAWDERHIHAPAQLAASKIRERR